MPLSQSGSRTEPLAELPRYGRDFTQRYNPPRSPYHPPEIHQRSVNRTRDRSENSLAEDTERNQWVALSQRNVTISPAPA